MKCAVRPQHEVFMNEVSPWLTGALYSYIPLAIIICASIAIVVRLTQASISRASLTGDAATDTNTRKVRLYTHKYICIQSHQKGEAVHMHTQTYIYIYIYIYIQHIYVV